MSDVFEDRRDLDPHRERLWRLIEDTPNLDWLLLTKRIDKVKTLAPWSGKWPRNIWLGTTTENQRWFDKRAEHLLMHDTIVHFISAEPLLGALNISRHLASATNPSGINWVITGGESGAGARHTNPAWFLDLRDQCLAAGVAFFFKQWGQWGPEAAFADRAAPEKAQRIQLVGRLAQKLELVRAGRKHAIEPLLDGREWKQLPALLLAA